MEFFSGNSNLSHALRLAGKKGLSIDIVYSHTFDIMSNAGYGLAVVAILRLKHGPWLCSLRCVPRFPL